MKRISRFMILFTVLANTANAVDLSWPPQLPGGKSMVSESSNELLMPPANLRDDVDVAKKPPVVDFFYYWGQTYAAKLWSAWGDNLAVEDKCYSSIGDHEGLNGSAFLYEFDAKTKQLKQLVDVKKLLKLPDDHYTPGKIHSRIDLGSDGWLYFSTHRGSTRVTTPENHFQGDWIIRHHPQTGETEVVVHAPLPMQCLPTGLLDPDRLIFYAGTADGDYAKRQVQFLAYDVKNRKLLYSNEHGPYRYMIFARSTGRIYFNAPLAEGESRRESAAPLVRFDPQEPTRLVPINAQVGLRAATEETADGFVYTINGDEIWQFNTKTETARSLGPAVVGGRDYTASIDVDPKTGRYLYYIPGAHGGAEQDGSPLVQFDVQTRKRKVIAFLHPVFHKKYGYVPSGTYATSVSPDGGTVYVTWNGARLSPSESIGRQVRWNTCAFTAIHVPQSERVP